ncbi:MAG: hypothetical protein RLZZ196_868 [Bacteroidota bacterium]|jgi:hypothetical protein
MADETIVVTSETNTLAVTEEVNEVIVYTPGPQGPAGKTILNGEGDPGDEIGTTGDFYYDKTTSKFWGPKPADGSWETSDRIALNAQTMEYSWELPQVEEFEPGQWALKIYHNLGYKPNVTVKASSGDVLETGIDYNSVDELTLIMAQPFSGTAYLS